MSGLMGASAPVSPPFERVAGDLRVALEPEPIGHWTQRAAAGTTFSRHDQR